MTELDFALLVVILVEAAVSVVLIVLNRDAMLKQDAGVRMLVSSMDAERATWNEKEKDLLDRFMAKDFTEFKTVGQIGKPFPSRPLVVSDEDEATYQEQLAAAEDAERRMGVS